MKNKLKKFKPLFIVAFVFASLAGAPRAHATIQMSQLNVDSSLDSWTVSGNTHVAYQQFTPSSSFILKRVIVYPASTSQAYVTDCASINTAIWGNSSGFPIATFAPSDALGNFGSFAPDGQGACYLTTSATPTVTAGTTYNIKFGTNSVSSLNNIFLGTTLTTPTTGNKICQSTSLGSFAPINCGTSSGSVTQIAYVLGDSVTDGSPIVTNFTPRVVLNAPANNSATASTTVTFSGYYYVLSSWSGSVSNIQLNLTQNLVGDVAPVIITIPEIVAGSAQYFSTTYTLPTNTNWSVQASLNNTVYPLSSGVNTFWVVTNPNIASTTGFTGSFDPSGHCSTWGFGMNYLCDLVFYAWYPSPTSVSQFTTLNLSGKFPFSYIYDVPVLANELVSDSGSSGSFTITVPFSTFGSITLISASQLSAVPFASTIKLLVGYLLYIGTAMALWRMIHTQSHGSK